MTSISDRSDLLLPQSQAQRCHLLDTRPAPWLGSLFDLPRGILWFTDHDQKQLLLHLRIVFMRSVDTLFGKNDSPFVLVIVTFYSPEFIPTNLIGHNTFSGIFHWAINLRTRWFFADLCWWLIWITLAFLDQQFSSLPPHATTTITLHHTAFALMVSVGSWWLFGRRGGRVLWPVSWRHRSFGLESCFWCVLPPVRRDVGMLSPWFLAVLAFLRSPVAYVPFSPSDLSCTMPY